MAMTPAAYQKFKREMFDFIWSELDRYENQIERTDEVPIGDLFPRLRRMRCFGLMVPEEYGGVGLSVSQYLPILAEFSKIHGGIRVVVHVHNTTAKGVAQLGSPEQKRALLPKIATGEFSVAFGLTEPDAGTGRDLKSRAVRVLSEYLNYYHQERIHQGINKIIEPQHEGNQGQIICIERLGGLLKSYHRKAA